MPLTFMKALTELPRGKYRVLKGGLTMFALLQGCICNYLCLTKGEEEGEKEEESPTGPSS